MFSGIFFEPKSICRMMNFRLSFFSWLLIIAGFVLSEKGYSQISFNTQDLVNLTSPTSLQIGPDGRLYVSQQGGTLKVYKIKRGLDGVYTVLSTETINLINTNVINHDDNGTVNGSQNRQVTGIMVEGTPDNPILYVTSSDWRIGAGTGSNDSNLDTNSGVLSRLTWIGTSRTDPAGYWQKVDLIRGFPRSEENHAINGMDLDPVTNTMYIMIGGNTNKGAPSNNFNFSPEYALSACLVSVDMNAINAMAIQGTGQNQYVYDLPTIDDPTRINVNGITDPNNPNYDGVDVGDPFGGNNGLNQARMMTTGPVRVFSPGYRNAYDVVYTSQGRLYTFDNGPNTSWGGIPVGEGPAGTCSNGSNENGSYSTWDQLHFIDAMGYYGGHPNPTRANPSNFDIHYYQKIANAWTETAYYPYSSFPIKPVAPADAYPVECDYIDPNFNTDILAMINASTNGMCEYTASNFGGAMQGNLLAAAFDGKVYRFALNGAGDQVVAQAAVSAPGTNPLDVWAQPDNDSFPGTIWIAVHGSGKIVVLEPNDFIGNCTGDDNVALDEDGDGFNNADEIDNGTDPCSQASKPDDFDGDFLSDFNDNDDDNDGKLDTWDPFARDAANGLATNLPLNYGFSINNGDAIPNTMFGLGFTGLMTNGTQSVPGSDYLTLYDGGELNPGGATSKLGMEHIPAGDAQGGANTQQYAFQFGFNVDENSVPFTVHTRIESPFFAVNGSTIVPQDGMSQGLYLGNGTQDNYIKIALNAQGGAGGIEVVREVNGSFTKVDYAVAVTGNVLAAVAIELYLEVDPATMTVQPKIATDGGNTITLLGSPINIPASWLSSIDDYGLAAGVIATNGGTGQLFGATWDMIEVVPTSPYLLTPMPDLLRIRGAAPDIINLEDYFNDDGGLGNLTYSVQGNTGAYVGASISGYQLTLTYPADYTDVATITVRATDLDNYQTDATFTVTVTDPFTVLYRVNAGGGQLAATDGPAMDWVADDFVTPSWYRTNGGNNYVQNMPNFDPSVPAYVPVDLFDSERWDGGNPGDALVDEMKWSFPAPVSGEYEVHLFFGNTYSGTGNVGQRQFDVLLEGNLVLNDYDVVADVGTLVGVMKTFTVTVTDGSIDIYLQHVLENPNIRGIEILGPPTAAYGFCSVEPDPVYFFSTPVNTSAAAQNVTITNYGARPMLISSVAMTGGNASMFSHSFTGPVTLQPGESNTFAVIFTPTSTGSKGTTLNVFHNGANASPSHIVVAGEAVVNTNYPTSMFINAGGGLFNAANGDVFAADNYFTNTSSTGANPYNISGTTDVSLYQTYRTGTAFTFETDITNGTYQIDLYFADLINAQNGDRVFNVNIEDKLMLEEFDIAREADFINGGISDNGQNYAVKKTIYVKVVDNDIVIDFYVGAIGAGQPIVSAIAVRPFTPVTGPAAFMEVNPGEALTATTTAVSSFHIQNTGTFDIQSVVIDLRTALLPDLVFDPEGNGGDGVGVCFTSNTGATQTGLITNGGGTGTASCVTPFSMSHNGGYQVLTIDFSDFNSLDELTFEVDIDPNSTQGNAGAGAPADISGYELTGATVTVNFAGGFSYTNNLFDAPGKGASNTIVALNPFNSGPVLSVSGSVANPVTLSQQSQTINVVGEPNTYVTLLVMDTRLFLENAQAPFDVLDPTYIGNQAMSSRGVYTAKIGAGGTASIPVSLLQTLGTNNEPNGGVNYIAAVMQATPFDAFSFTSPLSNMLTVKYQPNTFPVELLDLKAEAISQQEILISWRTLTEINNDHFEVEKSADGRMFFPIGAVDGAGTTSLEQKYKFIDNSDMYLTNYYRLKQIDVDGGFSFSNVVEVSMRYDGLMTMLLYPNPVQDVLQVRVADLDIQANYEIILIDAMGRALSRTSFSGESLATQANLDVSTLSHGVYLLECVGDNGRISTGRFVKQN